MRVAKWVSTTSEIFKKLRVYFSIIISVSRFKVASNKKGKLFEEDNIETIKLPINKQSTLFSSKFSQKSEWSPVKIQSEPFS